MATMKTLNGYGFNATELNGKAASDYLQKTDTASDSAKLGGKAPEYYLQPRNLLDNSDFRNPVNQRAITSADVSAWTYFIDRWKVEDNTLTISVETDGIHLTASSGAWFAQWIQMSDNDVGKTFTLAYGLSDGSIIMASGTMPDTSEWSEFITGANDAAQIRSACFENRKITVGINPKSNLVIKWAALYEGSYTADTLPPYMPKGYAAELAECQRYFERLGSTFSEQVGNVVYVASGAKSFICSLQCSRKRIAHPSVSISGVNNYRLLLKDATNASVYGAASISSFNDVTVQEPFISFRVNIAETTINQNSWIQLQRADGATAAYIDVSADI